MTARKIELDETVIEDQQGNAVRELQERAERAEAELTRLKADGTSGATGASTDKLKQPASPNTAAAHGEAPEVSEAATGGEHELRKDSMMAHLLNSLDAGKDVGHYGRLAFAMVARHFLPHDEVMAWLCKDRDFSEEQARLMLKQVEDRDYSPPRRERLLEWQDKQDFVFLPNPDDPDCGNLYRNLTFPEAIYEHIGHYQEARQEAVS